MLQLGDQRRYAVCVCREGSERPIWINSGWRWDEFNDLRILLIAKGVAYVYDLNALPCGDPVIPSLAWANSGRGVNVLD